MSDKVCAMFAGQSVQESGMCKELWTHKPAREILERLKPSLGADLETVTTTMPDPELALTFNAQRAIHAHHLGHWFAYKAYHFTDVESELEACPGVSVALHNTIRRGTLGGTMAALEAFSKKAQAEDWPVRVKILKVEGPYHTAAFAPARAALTKASAGLKIDKPACPVFMGTSGKAESDPERIRELLVAQVDSRERHQEAVRAAYDSGCRRFVEAATKPQPVTWLNEQLVDDAGAPLPGFTAVPIPTADLR
jgi:malonyl CoA-acyl carrier protein transacylase